MPLGAFQITGSSVSKPSDIDLHDLHVTNCAPADLTKAYNAGNGSDAWYCSFIGSSSASATLIDKVRLRNSDFTDSPLGIQGGTNVTLDNVKLLATGLTKSSTLFITDGVSVTGTTVELNNVTSTRPKGVPTGAPAANQFASCIYIENATVRGNNVKVVGGGAGIRAQGGADVQFSNPTFEDNYNYGIAPFSAGTKIKLQSPTVRLNIAANTSWAGLDFNNGGASATGWDTVVLSPDIQAVTTNAGQNGIRLSPTPFTVGPPASGGTTKVVGGIVKLTGTSSTPILTGGNLVANSVVGVLTSHPVTLGTLESPVSGGNVVNASI